MVSSYPSARGVVITLLWASANAAPVQRTMGDERNPIPMTVDVSQWQSMAEENCYVMLCQYGGQRKWQRGHPGKDQHGQGSDHNTTRHRQAAGTNTNPFYAQNLTDRHTQQLDSSTTSAEEFPWASMMQGGEGGPSDARRTAGPKPDPSSVYCRALFKTPPDFSVCKGKKKTDLYGHSVNPGDYDYVKVPDSRPIVFQHPK
ncbi:hypothetical protein PG993_003930 [Apiospora rasikravindrae]|uniref:Uncharacterized protein n=1 Tax=Apiospora rasikravindrae TaxID=990691 RepID=A0ABR1U0X3_9PEZI